MAKRRSEQGSIIAYFSLAPLDQAEALYNIVSELVRRRRNEGKPRKSKIKIKTEQSENLLWQHDNSICSLRPCTKELEPSHWKPRLKAAAGSKP